MMMGSSAVFIDCDEFWKLLLVTRKGSLFIWDLFNRKCLLHDSLDSLITTDLKSNAKDAGVIKVISAKLSKSGFPLVVLATRHAYLFDTSLMCWLRVGDDFFPASNFASSSNLGSAHGGELAALQVDIRKFLARKPGWSRVTDDGVQTRAHLEAQLASALSLESPKEYCQCLLSYIRFLAREADECRLREVCESFLGPPIGMAEAGLSDLKIPEWDPFVLGMSKHKILREDILPSMASNRKVQRLLNEFMDRLSEYDNIDRMTLEQKNLTLATPTSATDEKDSDLSAANKTNSNVTVANQINPVEPDNDGVDPALQTTDQSDIHGQSDSIHKDKNQDQPVQPTSGQMNVDPPFAEPLDTYSQSTKEKDS